MNLVLSFVLAAAGIVLVGLGIWDVARLIHGSKDERVYGPTDPASWAELVKASPRWLLLVTAGVVLIFASVAIAA